MYLYLENSDLCVSRPQLGIQAETNVISVKSNALKRGGLITEYREQNCSVVREYK